MKKVYTAFQFGNYSSNSGDILNVSLDNDMYSESVRGARVIIEEKVQGVEAPYFFYVDNQPLNFEVNFAFVAKTKLQIKSLLRVFLSQQTYTELTFGEFENSSFVAKSPIYNVIFIDEPIINFIGRNVENELKYDGYFTLQARCDRPYGYVNETKSLTRSSAGEVIVNGGDLELLPNIIISSTNPSAQNFTITRYSDNTYATVVSQMTFTGIDTNETITFKQDFFTIKATGAGADNSTVYSRWNKNYFSLIPGNNFIKVLPISTTTDVTVQLQYKAPLFIKE
jgi:hypothetical protein